MALKFLDSTGYGYKSGTSMASLHVAGAAALVWSANPAVTATQVKDVLLGNADDITDTAKPTVTNGRLNVNKALVAALALAPPLPELSVDDVTVTVDYATANGTATAPDDFTDRSGSLTFDPGVTSQTIAVPVAADSLVEGGETFLLNLTNPQNARIQDGQGLGSITDDDDVATLHVGDLDGAPQSFWLWWRARVTVTVEDSQGNLVANATVSGNWSGGYSGSATGTTNGNGQVTIVSGWMGSATGSATFTVTGITHASLEYRAADNHDPDGDSNGTTMRNYRRKIIDLGLEGVLFRTLTDRPLGWHGNCSTSPLPPRHWPPGSRNLTARTQESRSTFISC